MKVALAWCSCWPSASAAGARRRQGQGLDDLLFDLQLVPMAGQTPPAFELEKLIDGKKVTLAELRGRPVLLYFWASW
jgi:hypothetical protein